LIGSNKALVDEGVEVGCELVELSKLGKLDVELGWRPGRRDQFEDLPRVRKTYL
jgi:hypothetical protein